MGSKGRAATFVATWFALATLALTVRAAHVEPMDVRTMAELAGQVIVGEVAEVRSYWADQPRRLESELTFVRVAYLKGAPPATGGKLAPADTFALIVPGGQVGEVRMRICCSPTFEVGQRWVLFLLPTYKTYPVVGLYRGAFRIEADEAGVPRIYDAEAQPVLGIDAEGFVASAGRSLTGAHEHLVGAHGLRLVAPETAENAEPQAVSFDEFVAAVQPILAASRRYDLTGPAGQPVLVEPQAAPLRLAPGAGAAGAILDGTFRAPAFTPGKSPRSSAAVNDGAPDVGQRPGPEAASRREVRQ